MYSLKLLFCICLLLVSNLLLSQDCSFNINYEQQSCSEYHLFATGEEILDWYVDNVFQVTSTEYAFNPSTAGTYEICAVNEGCPPETNVCETFVITEDCLETECPLSISYEEHSCDSFTFTEDNGTQVDWTINGEFYAYFHGIDFDPTEPGTYEICAIYETPECPLGVTACEILVITEDCFEDDCAFDVEIEQQSCSEYHLFATGEEILDWYVDNVFQVTSTEYDFNPSTAGTYEICAVNEGCPPETNVCETFVITEDCLETECPLSISYEEHSCDSFTFTEDNGTQVDWTINGEFYAYFHGIDFDPTEPGTYEICAIYETPECPLGVTACEILVITEDCFEDDCAFDVEIEQQSCSEYHLFATGEEILDWYVDNVFQVTSTEYDFNPSTAGTYEICAVNEGCPPETNVCETFVITEDCLETECPLSISYEEHSCDSFTFTEDNGTQVDWTINGEFYAYFHGIDFDPTEPGTYEICAIYETPECPLGVTACEILVITEDCFEDDCAFDVEIEQQSCSEYHLFATGEEILDWYVDNVFQVTSTEYDFNPSTAGTYEICAVNEGCPPETNVCETFVITEDCLETECPLSISYEEHSCDSFTFTEDNGTQVDWTINGEFYAYFHGIDFDPTEPGTYEICAIYETPECPLGVTACEILVITEDCFEDDCAFDVEIEQQSCSEYHLFATGEEILDWYVDNVFQVTSTEYDFNPSTAGTYEICAVNEGCPPETNVCETFVITEDCLETECPLSISYEEHSCDSFTFTEDNGTQVDWTINGEFYAYFHGIDFDPTEPGTYEICAIYETPECPLGVTACETLVITEDCFEDDCAFDVEIEQQSCSEYHLFATGEEILDWYVDNVFQVTSTEYAFNPSTAGTYEICAVNEGCPPETNVCETFVITEDCLETECPLSISYEEHSCDSFTFTEDNGTQVDWTINGEFYAYFHGIDFDPTEPGTYEICAIYETPECPLGVTACETLVITEDCFEDDCAFDVEIEQQSCSEYHLFATGEEILDWYVDNVFQVTSTEYAFNPSTAGTYEICAVNEGCPPETNVCETFVITEDCLETECPLSISYEEHSCDSFTFTEDNGTQVDWTINGEFYAYFHGIDFDPTEPGTYEICAIYETPECPLGVTACEILVVTEDCFEDDCAFDVEIEQQSCSEHHLFATGEEILDWYVDNVFQVTSTEYDFNPSTAGTYEICAVNEGCPPETNVCETFVITEDCLDSVTLVSENEISDLFSVYPNPSKGAVNIAGNVQILDKIHIRDALGSLVYLSNDPSNEAISLADLPSGTYFIYFSSAEGVFVKKLLLNK